MHGRLHHLAGRKGRLHRHVVPALGHEIVAVLAQPGATLHGLALVGFVSTQHVGPFHSRLTLMAMYTCRSAGLSLDRPRLWRKSALDLLTASRIIVASQGPGRRSCTASVAKMASPGRQQRECGTEIPAAPQIRANSCTDQARCGEWRQVISQRRRGKFLPSTAAESRPC